MQTNTIRRSHDTGVFMDRRGIIKTKQPLDLSRATSVEGFVIGGVDTSKTLRRFAFSIDENWYRLSSDASLVSLTEQDASTECVLEEGNSAAQLHALSSIPAFAGKKIGVAIALQAPIEGEAPTVSLAIKCKNTDDTPEKEFLSQAYAFEHESEVLDIVTDMIVSDGGKIDLKAKLTKQDGSETEWIKLSDCKGQMAKGIMYRAVLTAETIGVSKSQLNSVLVKYGNANEKTGNGVANIVSITRNWNIPIASVRMTVRHSSLIDSKLSGAVAFRTTPAWISGEEIGIGTGELVSYPLTHSNGIHQDTVRLYFDGKRQYSGFEVNAESGRIHCAAPLGERVTADYEYGWNTEIWQEMIPSGTRRDANYDNTEFRFNRPNKQDEMSVCAVKIVMETQRGSSEGEAIGIGTGEAKSYKIQHAAQPDSIMVFVDGAPVSSAIWCLSDDSRNIKIAAPKKSNITIDYLWTSEVTEVYQFAAIFAE